MAKLNISQSISTITDQVSGVYPEEIASFEYIPLKKVEAVVQGTKELTTQAQVRDLHFCRFFFALSTTACVADPFIESVIDKPCYRWTERYWMHRTCLIAGVPPSRRKTRCHASVLRVTLNHEWPCHFFGDTCHMSKAFWISKTFLKSHHFQVAQNLWLNCSILFKNISLLQSF